MTLDFAAMDLSEFYADIVAKMPNVTAIQGTATYKRWRLLLRRREMLIKLMKFGTGRLCLSIELADCLELIHMLRMLKRMR